MRSPSTDSQHLPSADPLPPLPISWFKLAGIGCGGFVGLLLLICGGLALVWAFTYGPWSADRYAVEKLLADAESRGEPVTGEQLNDFYHVDPTRPDDSVAWNTIFAKFESEGVRYDLVTFENEYVGPYELTLEGDFTVRGYTEDLATPLRLLDRSEPLTAHETLGKIRRKALIESHADFLSTVIHQATIGTNARLDVDLTHPHFLGAHPCEIGRRVVSFLVVACDAALEDGDVGRAADANVAMLSLANLLGQIPDVSSVLTGHAITGNAFGRTRAILATNPSDEDLGRLEASWKSIEPSQCFQRAFQGERVELRWASEHYDEFRRDSRFLPSLRIAPWRDLRLGLTAIDEIIAELDRQQPFDDCERYQAALANEIQAIDEATDQAIVSAAYLASQEAFFIFISEQYARQRTALAAIAAARFARKYQRFPTTPTELMPEYLAAWPIDPQIAGPVAFELTTDEGVRQARAIYQVWETEARYNLAELDSELIAERPGNFDDDVVLPELDSTGQDAGLPTDDGTSIEDQRRLTVLAEEYATAQELATFEPFVPRQGLAIGHAGRPNQYLAVSEAQLPRYIEQELRIVLPRDKYLPSKPTGERGASAP